MAWRFLVAAASVFGLIRPVGAEDLLSFSDLEYVGAFRVPKISSPRGDVDTLNFGGQALGFRPGSPGSLFISCFAPAATIAEISIPAPGRATTVASLPSATLLQPCADPTAGATKSVGADVNGYRIGGILVSGGRLIVSKYAYYDASQDQTHAFFLKPDTDLSHANAAGAFAIGNAPQIGFVDGWIAPVPPAWQSVFKGPVMSGNDSIAIVGRTSSGPDAFAWNPAAMTDVNVAAPSTPLFYYPLSHPMLGAWGNTNPIDNVTNFWNGSGSGYHGAVFPDGTRSALFFGSQGLDPKGFCYGVGTSDRSLDRTPVPNTNGQVMYCYDPANSSKGTHGYPYQYQVMAFDLNDMAAVAAGATPWNVKPYAVWPLVNGLPGIDGARNESAGGAVYDPVAKRIYFSAPAVDQVETYSSLPVIYVWQVNAPGSGDSTPPATPRNVAGVPGPARATVSWSPNTEPDLGGYNVYRAAAAGGPFQKQNAGWLSALPFTQTGLTNGTELWFAVTAIDMAGNESARSAAVRVVPGASAPDPMPSAEATGLVTLIDRDHPQAVIRCDGAAPSVLNQRGVVVRPTLPSAGPSLFSWDGRTASGLAPDGGYLVTCGRAVTRVMVAR
jgi:hypothetical protein